MIAVPVRGKFIFRNGGVECDVLQGPCSCGAWHRISAHYSNSKEEIYRYYISYFNEKENNGKS
jgi:hypothetical protein